MACLRAVQPHGLPPPIELAITSAIGAGYDARFNVDALLRSDTTTRYEAHNLAIGGGWKTVDEVRADEGLAPLQQPAPAPAPKELT
ncbi:phage portal protein [Tessaracoccus sp. HDW20]|uniref:phage portal protein n=1 Tax=Tessaracoccus coleopterorum TaxID=2714950 RepID=UPI0018D3E312|nr:phage portal protein [Tessaracoccus coleopterorum]NHB85212.1 phage portal protein [Tessaracoccus coleopterorum]